MANREYSELITLHRGGFVYNIYCSITDPPTVVPEHDGDLALAGSGLYVRTGGTWTLLATAGIGGTPILVSSTPYTVQPSDRVLLVTTAAAVINLPAVTSFTGNLLRIKDRIGAAGSSPLTINPDGAETIDGEASLSLNSDYVSVDLVPQGTEWSIL